MMRNIHFMQSIRNPTGIWFQPQNSIAGSRSTGEAEKELKEISFALQLFYSSLRLSERSGFTIRSDSRIM